MRRLRGGLPANDAALRDWRVRVLPHPPQQQVPALQLLLSTRHGVLWLLLGRRVETVVAVSLCQLVLVAQTPPSAWRVCAPECGAADHERHASLRVQFFRYDHSAFDPAGVPVSHCVRPDQFARHHRFQRQQEESQRA